MQVYFLILIPKRSEAF